MDALLWFSDNWPAFVQSVGIVSGLIFTGISLRRETAARRVTDLLTLCALHRDLWKEAGNDPALSRVFLNGVNLDALPLTLAEERFLNSVFVHFSIGWSAAVRGSLISVEALCRDVKDFFELPLPYSYWKKTKHAREPAFVAFVDDVLKL